MARVTIEDCLDVVPNSYELVVLAARRAHQIVDGGTPLVTVEDEREEKAAVVALREIADNKINPVTDFSSLDAQYQREAQERRAALLAEAQAELHAVEG